MDTAAIIEMHPLSYLFPEDHDCPPWRLWLYVATLSLPHLDEEIFFWQTCPFFKPLHFISRVVIYEHNLHKYLVYRVSSETVYTLILLFSRVPDHIQKNFWPFFNRQGDEDFNTSYVKDISSYRTKRETNWILTVSFWWQILLLYREGCQL